MKNKHEIYTDKMLRKLEAHLKGKHTKITYPNPNERDKNRQFITVSGFDLWGDPKAKRTQNQD